MDKQPLGLLNNPEKTLFTLSPLRHTTEMVLLIYLFPFFLVFVVFFWSLPFASRLAFPVCSAVTLHEFKQYYRRVSSFVHRRPMCII